MIDTSFEEILQANGHLDLVKDDKIVLLIRTFQYKSYLRVTSDLRGRLDLISQDEYDTPSLWWYIAIYNGIIDPFNFTNAHLYIPELNPLQNLLIDAMIKRNSP